jgi:hypothetical protein
MTQISIHVPRQGTTDTTHVIGRLGSFQSTRPRGTRPARSAITRTSSSFNPRARVGARPRDVGSLFEHLHVSIHVPHIGPRLRLRAAVSVGAATRARSNTVRVVAYCTLVSILASTWSAKHVCRHHRLIAFQSTRLRGRQMCFLHGRDITSVPDSRCTARFNPHAHFGRETG